MRLLVSIALLGTMVGASADMAIRQAEAASDPMALAAAQTLAVEGSPLGDADKLNLRSASLLVLEQPQGRALVARNPEQVTPIASITKLMTAMTVLDGRLSMDEIVTVGDADVDRLKGTHSRLRTGSRLSRRELLRLALMASENRAAAALARSYPKGRAAFIAAMNRKAEALGMGNTRFVDSTGLSKGNVSTARDLSRMVSAAIKYPLIRQFTTTASHTLSMRSAGAGLVFRNSNRLVQVGSRDWKIALSKTGYTAEAGRCLVMHATIRNRPVILVLLNSWGKLTPIGDANRIRRWMESQPEFAKPPRIAGAQALPTAASGMERQTGFASISFSD